MTLVDMLVSSGNRWSGLLTANLYTCLYIMSHLCPCLLVCTRRSILSFLPTLVNVARFEGYNVLLKDGLVPFCFPSCLWRLGCRLLYKGRLHLPAYNSVLYSLTKQVAVLNHLTTRLCDGSRFCKRQFLGPSIFPVFGWLLNGR